MALSISRGVIQKAQKIVVYGPEGIGKSTFAAQFPDPLFIDTEGSTNHMDVARLPRPSSWTMLLSNITEVKNTPGCCKTLVVDTIDWAEQLCVNHICATYNKKGIEDFGYGKGYVFVKEEIGRFLNLLTDVIDAGINVVLTAHAQIRKFELPDECGSFDRYEMKLGNKTGSATSQLVKEWADMVLFANYKQFVVEVNEKKKAQGGSRVMFTEHHPCWDAKNRCGLKPELPFDFSQIAQCMPALQVTTSAKKQDPKPANKPEPKQEPAKESPVQEIVRKMRPQIAEEDRYMYHPESDSYWMIHKGEKVEIGDGLSHELSKAEWEKGKLGKESVNPTAKSEEPKTQNETKAPKSESQHDNGVPVALADLMAKNGIDDMHPNGVEIEEIQRVVSIRGYYPDNTPIAKYDPGFIDGVLVGAWDQVYAMIQDERNLPY